VFKKIVFFLQSFETGYNFSLFYKKKQEFLKNFFLFFCIELKDGFQGFELAHALKKLQKNVTNSYFSFFSPVFKLNGHTNLLSFYFFKLHK
jgi:hypothetical protein